MNSIHCKKYQLVETRGEKVNKYIYWVNVQVSFFYETIFLARYISSYKLSSDVATYYVHKILLLIIHLMLQPSSLDPNVMIGTPVKYEMRGFNSLLGSHYDHYYLIYEDFRAEKPSNEVFRVPDCKFQA